MNAITTRTPIILNRDEGEKRWFAGGGVFTVKASAEETGGAFLLWEDHMEKGKVTPLHFHPESDETLYVLEGEILFHVDGENHRVSAGGVVVAPRLVPHAFVVVSDTANLLCLTTPGCNQAFYWDASDVITAEHPASGIVDFDRIKASGQKNGGITILGPPPFAKP